MPTTTKRLEDFSHLRALVIGDIMLDRFVYGTVERISPESPAPLLNMRETRSMLGGVGNVVRNLSALGASVTLHTCVGDDATGKEIITLIGKEPCVIGNIITESNRPSTLKVRYVADGQQMLRADHETKRPISQETNRKILASMCGEFIRHDVLVISDYQKGLLSTELLRLCINFAREHQLPVIIDPKPRVCVEYRGATVITPNLHEMAQICRMTGCPVSNFDTDEDILEAALWLAKQYEIEHVLVTRGKDGMTLASRSGSFSHIPARAHEVYDVSGAGDTVVATLSLALASGMSPEDAAVLANTAAGIAVERLGTSVVSQLDLQLAKLSSRRIGGIHKIMSLTAAKDIVSEWKRDGRKVGFANGCFDLIHPGHITLLAESRSRCDRMIVAINSNNSVRQLKGENRPVQDQHDRAMILASMECVDLVLIFDEATPITPITALIPDVLFKGSDYTPETTVGASIVEDNGGEVIILPRTATTSTSRIIEKAGAAYRPELIVNNHQ